MITTNLENFGYLEREIAQKLLEAWNNLGLPENFYDKNIKIMMNQRSGCVFLINSEYQVAMLNNDKLELFYSCPICGHEGFLEDMPHNENEKECQEYLQEIGGTNADS